MHDTLFRGIHAIEADTVLSAIGFERIDLRTRYRIADFGARVGRYIVVGGRKGEFGMAHRAIIERESFKRLR